VVVQLPPFWHVTPAHASEVSQLVPLKPVAHVHTLPLVDCAHVPLLRHGLGSQPVTAVVHVVPLQFVAHLHVYDM
jgi:hypothetical protein